ncbi:MAG: oxygen-independent coproporphyrinogen III oxidase [Lachnospiraceae bacterium]|nr:oxygen-independent coproporphyrinogen III oxidase [Lachnospiraceae bacterium]
MSDLEIYVHIPFCVRKCAYCDFLSGPADEDAKARYLTGLFDEFRFYAEKLKSAETRKTITTVFVGGGTPSSLSAGQLDSLFEKLHSSFGIGKEAEVTVECNPGTLSAEKLSVLKNAGVNRLSLGLQSADDSELKLLGRIHTFEDFLREYEAARRTGFDNINVDLMQALPGQTVEKALNSVKKVLELQPEHISAYSLIIEEGTPFFARYGEHPELLPDEVTDRAIYHTTEETLAAAGFVHYEISNYARPGRECRHNKGYWTGTDYIGMGLGAASLLDGVRFNNVRQLKDYLSGDPSSHRDPSSVEALSPEDRMAEFMFLGLRLLEGVEKKEFESRFGRSLFEVYGDVVKKHVAAGLLKDDGKKISLTERGIDISNSVLCDFLPD